MPTGFKITEASGASWVKQNSLLNTGWGTNTVQDGIYANGKYTVVGTGGRIADSVDGINWTDRPHLRLNTQWGTGTIYTISWNGSVYFISGDSAYTATSTDGITWIFSSLMSSAWTTGNPAVDSLWNGSNFIVVGASNKFAISNNGVSFSSYNNGPGTPGLFEKRINWNGSQYLMTAGTTGLAYTSPDATTWTSRDVTGSNSAWLSESVIKVRYVNGIFVAGGTNGRIATSADGLTWTYRPGIGTGGFGNSIYEIVWDGSKYVFVTSGSDYVGSTTDFVTYTATWNPALGSAFGSFFTTVLISNSGKYVISSNYGRTSYSGDNGVTWSAFTGVSANAGAFGASLYLLVRDSGAYSTSPDGTTWTSRTGLSSGTWGTKGIRDILWNGSKFIVVGDSGGVATSSDGLTWTYQAGLSSTAWSTTSVRCVAWTGSQFIVGGDSGKIATSSDGVTWTYQGGLISTGWGTTNISSIAWSGTRYVVGGTAGAIAHSSDAATWTFLGGSFNLKDSYYGLNTINTIIWNPTSNTYLVAGNSGRVATGNTAGVIWSYQGGLANTAWGTTNVRDGLWDGSKYILVGDSGKVATSADGVTWTNQTGLSSTSYSTNTSNKVLANGTNQYIVAGTSFNTANSSNAVTWTYQSGLTSTGWSIDTITKIVYNGTFWLAVGPAGKIATSYDKINWTFQNGLRSTSWGTTDNINDVVWSGTQFVVAGVNGKIATSPNGVTWTYQSGLSSTAWTTTSVAAIAYGNGKYVVGGGGTGTTAITATSPDGITWTYSSNIDSIFQTKGLYALTFGGGVFCAVGQYSAGAVSSDGITWTSGLIGAGNINFTELIWGNNEFVAATSFGATVYSSPNGITWTAKTTITEFASRGLLGLFYYKQNYYAYGQEGRIIKSPNLVTWTALTSPSVSGSLIPSSIDITTIAADDSQFLVGGTSTGMYLGAPENYQVDVDDLLVRREYFSDGNLFGWGNNGSGQLGDGTTSARSSPVTTADSGVNWKQVSSSSTHSAAIKSDGTLWTWGGNGSGQLGTGNTTSRSSPGTTAGGGTNWKQVSSGYLTTAGIKTDGTLWLWGAGNSGVLGDNTTTAKSSPVQTIAAGANWKQVSIGLYTAAAVKTDGTLWIWGYNNIGQLGDGTTTDRSSPITTAGGGTNWKQVDCGGSTGFNCRHVAAVKTDGTLWTWGNNQNGALGDGTTTNRSSPGTTVGGGTNWKQVSCGVNHAGAVKTDGTLWMWGWNDYGSLGFNAGGPRSSPVTTAGGGTNWKQVACGARCTMAIKTDGTLWTWGINSSGQLGDGTTTSRSSPGTTAGGGTNWKQVSCGLDGDKVLAVTDLTI